MYHGIILTSSSLDPGYLLRKFRDDMYVKYSVNRPMWRVYSAWEVIGIFSSMPNSLLACLEWIKPENTWQKAPFFSIPQNLVTAFAGKPEWIRVKLPSGPNYASLKNLVKDLSLNTVCEEARCPNIEECWNGGTATFMLMGDTCTRACRFCSVKSGKPDLALDQLEPEHVAEAIVKLNLTYAVLTSVNRDDLSDGGASHFAKTVRAIKSRNCEILVETLIPDFNGDPNALDIIIDSGAEVIAQNMETVHRLTKKVRDSRSGYEKTLSVLEYIKLKKSSLFTKSSLMLGLGEEDHEIFETMDDLRSVGVDILTLGQYLQPTQKHLPVKEYLHPTRFDRMAAVGREKGFAFVAAGPLVRSSYRAGEFFIEHLVRKRGIRNGAGAHG